MKGCFDDSAEILPAPAGPHGRAVPKVMQQKCPGWPRAMLRISQNNVPMLALLFPERRQYITVFYLRWLSNHICVPSVEMEIQPLRSVRRIF